MVVAEDTQAMNAALDELLPLCRGQRPPARFHLDPVGTSGGVRDYYRKYLEWLALPVEALPKDRFYLNDGLPFPSYLEHRSGQFALYLDVALFRSPEVIALALVHEFSHLFLMVNGRQEMLVSRRTSSPISRLDAEQEARTDVAAIALGFGKPLLNGLAAYEDVFGDDDEVGEVGGLSLATAAAVYRRVNDAIRVPGMAATEGLSDEAKAAVQRG